MQGTGNQILGKRRDVEARKLLEDVVKQVQPIMMKPKWRVKVLSELWYSIKTFYIFIFLVVGLVTLIESLVNSFVLMVNGIILK